MRGQRRDRDTWQRREKRRRFLKDTAAKYLGDPSRLKAMHVIGTSLHSPVIFLQWPLGREVGCWHQARSRDLPCGLCGAVCPNGLCAAQELSYEPVRWESHLPRMATEHFKGGWGS